MEYLGGGSALDLVRMISLLQGVTYCGVRLAEAWQFRRTLHCNNFERNLERIRIPSFREKTTQGH